MKNNPVYQGKVTNYLSHIELYNQIINNNSQNIHKLLVYVIRPPSPNLFLYLGKSEISNPYLHVLRRNLKEVYLLFSQTRIRRSLSRLKISYHVWKQTPTYLRKGYKDDDDLVTIKRILISTFVVLVIKLNPKSQNIKTTIMKTIMRENRAIKTNFV